MTNGEVPRSEDDVRSFFAAPTAGGRAEQLVAVAQRLRTRVDRVTRRWPWHRLADPEPQWAAAGDAAAA